MSGATFDSVRSTIYSAYHLIDCLKERLEYSDDAKAAAHTAALEGIKIVLDRAGDEVEEVQQKTLEQFKKFADRRTVDEDAEREQQGAVVIDLFEVIKRSLALKNAEAAPEGGE